MKPQPDAGPDWLSLVVHKRFGRGGSSLPATAESITLPPTRLGGGNVSTSDRKVISRVRWASGKDRLRPATTPECAR
jgi:hypothetical protein